MAKKIIVLLVLLAGFSSAWAENVRYVSDKLIITVRSGPSIQYKVVRKIESGARVEVLDISDDQEYSKIRTQNGTEGWVLTQYLMENPIAEQQLAIAEEKKLKAEEKTEQLAQSVNQLKQKIKELETANALLTKNNADMSVEITAISKAAARPVELDRENRDLRESIGKISTDLQVVNSQYQKLKDAEQQEWFIIGAGVLLAGMLLGFIIPKVRFSRKDSWGSL